MVKIRAKTHDIRAFILEQVKKQSANIGVMTAEHFGITRQAVNKHLHKLLEEKILIETGSTRNKNYTLATILDWKKIYKIEPALAEDIVWRNDVLPILSPMPNNVESIWHYGVTEMFNNAIDHSGGTEITIQIKKTAINTEIIILDNGVGIFKKIQSALNLIDERHALFELSKGKLTTDPKRHSGEGIFFSSRIFDMYSIFSGAVIFSHRFGLPEDWILKRDGIQEGTAVCMELNNNTSRIQKDIFDQYASPSGDYKFNKTVVPVYLAKYGNDQLISRSQAKRLLARVELFKTVILDFNKIELIGQGFADEIFRVFANEHPEIKLSWINASKEVEQMIRRVAST